MNRAQWTEAFAERLYDRPTIGRAKARREAERAWVTSTHDDPKEAADELMHQTEFGIYRGDI